MIDNSIDAFFALIKAGLWGVSNDKASHNQNLDGITEWDNVYQLTQEQSVLGLALQGIESLRILNVNLNIPQVLLLKWIGEVQLIERRNKAMNAFVAELIEKLYNHGVDVILVKGQGVAQFYENPLRRTSGDVDLLLIKDNYQKAQKILIPISSLTEPEDSAKKHLAINIYGWTVELHGTLRCGLSKRIDKVLDSVGNDTMRGEKPEGRGKIAREWKNGETNIHLLAVENDVFYIFIHILQHFYKGGIGLRQICDWCRLLWSYKDSLDYNLLEQQIKKAGLVNEWRAFNAFVVSFLGMPKEAMPLYVDSSKWQKKAEKIRGFIFEVGDFGRNRDASYYGKYPFLIRKTMSFGQRLKDVTRHARIFPLDSVRFFFGILYNGIVSSLRGE